MNPLMNDTALRNALFLIFLLAGVVAPAGADQLASSPPQSRDRIDASKLYHKYCAPCHGDHGDGNSRAQTALDPPPRNFTTAKSREELSPERMLTSVTYGRPGTAMVGWKRRLSEAQIAAIVSLRAQDIHAASRRLDAGRAGGQRTEATRVTVIPAPCRPIPTT